MIKELTIEDSDAFHNIVKLIKNPVYWKDQGGKYLGCNQHLLKLLRLTNQDQIIGKTDGELWDPLEEDKPQWIESDQLALKNGECAIEISKTIAGEKTFFILIKSRLVDKNGHAVGILGFLTDSISHKLNTFKDQLVAEKEHQMNQIIDLVNASIYWKDKEGRYLGCNKYVLYMAGLSDKNQIIGKTDADLSWKANAAQLMETDRNVINNGPYVGEEKITLANGLEDIYWTVKNQLIDSNGNIIGIIGTSLDITAQREAEQREAELRQREKAHQEEVFKEQEKLINLAHTVAHDISSPLSALSMMMRFCDELPESKRTVIKRAAESILDIANNLLSTYREENKQASVAREEPQAILISDLISQLLSEKKVQYSNHPVYFEADMTDEAQFAFVYVQVSQLRRALSNLINNAVDALVSQGDGVVTLVLTADNASVTVCVGDNGKGMPPNVVEKILRRQTFTEGKQSGHGLGLQQVWATLDDNQGGMKIDSTPNKGTAIQITFPRITAPEWIAQTIDLKPDSILVILDDEESIHGAWDARFAQYVTVYPSLRAHHFKQGTEALTFFQNLNQKDQSRLVFLSDYELLRQNKNGLQIMEEGGIPHATLVTSYYTNASIRDQAIQLGIKILPKQMASIVPIYLE